jgi:hypothetical protein
MNSIASAAGHLIEHEDDSIACPHCKAALSVRWLLQSIALRGIKVDVNAEAENEMRERLRSEYEAKLAEKFDEVERRAKEYVAHRDCEANDLLRKMSQERDAAKDKLREAMRKLDAWRSDSLGSRMEVNIAKSLSDAFPHDHVARNQVSEGADIIHSINDEYGAMAGLIVVECKDSLQWYNDWVNRLRENKARHKADFALLVASKLGKSFDPNGFGFAYVKGVHLCHPEYALAIVSAAREFILHKPKNLGDATAEALSAYFSGDTFKDRIRQIVESAKGLRGIATKLRTQAVALDDAAARIEGNSTGIERDVAKILVPAVAEIRTMASMEQDADKLMTEFIRDGILLLE